jgi:hypothetical protein
VLLVRPAGLSENRGKMKHRIYVAGPYAPKNCSLHEAPRVAQFNVDKAIEIATDLIEKGHLVFVPHVHSHYINIHYSSKRDYKVWWYEEDFSFLNHWATALFYIGPSVGASKELALAKKKRLTIFYNLSEVPEE